jgi:hypothetical protein
MAISKQRIEVITYGERAYEERKAAVAGIYPGMVCEITSDLKVQPHSTEGGKVEVLVAIEDALQGHTVDDAYTVNEPVRLMRFRPGDHCLLRQHVHTNIACGEQVVSHGDGTVRSASDSGSFGDTAFAKALEASNLSALNTEALIECVIL